MSGIPRRHRQQRTLCRPCQCYRVASGGSVHVHVHDEGMRGVSMSDSSQAAREQQAKQRCQR